MFFLLGGHNWRSFVLMSVFIHGAVEFRFLLWDGRVIYTYWLHNIKWLMYENRT